ncbi:oxygenase MpaB family protein [Streptomyces sp. SID3343]|uniref:oxygenase MpaB family protein n=1 Tax=Streptomyces sp. SID3343 TaxID=2690260 RepID=UPI00136CC4A5|nr:oxygenase MpaB family protein [Streptomyces sp. SID3343]MYW01415.1 DUF2236 domain-containing protein [Streptomyces sp. SID3343]
MSDAEDGFPGPGSSTWELLGQWRLLTTIGRAIVLETAHPVVSAGVTEFSTYRRHPWRRVEQTLLSLQRLVYQDPLDREREAARLHRLHSHINGVASDGRPYDALDPDAQAWVHLTVFDAMVVMCEFGGDPMDDERQAELYAQWLVVGEQLGVPGSAMPSTLDAFRTYFDETVREKLVLSEGVGQFLEAFDKLPPPAQLSFVPDTVWEALCSLLGAGARTVLLATLPPAYREKMGERGTLPFGAEAAVSLACRTASVVASVLPTKWAYMPLAATFITAKREAEHSLRRAGLGGGTADAAPDVAEAFARVLDQTGDGVLSWPDLAATARVFSSNLDLGEVEEEALYAAFHAWWLELRAAADTNHDGVLDVDEYRAFALTACGPAFDAVTAAIAAAVDRDGDGRIDHADYASLLDGGTTAIRRLQWLHEMDADGDGMVSVDEFAGALRSSILGRTRSETLEHVMGRA